MSETTGLRVASLRRRAGITQEQLAERTGLSVSVIRKVEHDDCNVMLDTLHRIARGLGVTTGELFVPPKPVDPAVDPAAPETYALRYVLEPVELPDEPTKSLEALRADVAEAAKHVMADAYDEAVPALATLIPEARLALEEASDADRHEVGSVLTSAYDLSAQTLILLQDDTLADHAIGSMYELAEAEGDELWAGMVAVVRGWLDIRRGLFSQVIQSCEEAARPLEPDVRTTDPQRLMVWGELMRRISAAASRNSQDGLADDALRRAGIAASMLRRDHRRAGWCFGPTTVARAQTEVAVVSYDYEGASESAKLVRPDVITQRDRNRFLLDVAKIHLEQHKQDRAVSILTGIQAEVPHWLAHQPYARDITAQIVRRTKRAMSPELRSLAELLRVA